MLTISSNWRHLWKPKNKTTRKKEKKKRKRQNGKQKSAKNSEKLGKTELKNALKTLTKRAERQRTYPTNPYRYRFSCGYGYTAILLLFGGFFSFFDTLEDEGYLNFKQIFIDN